MVTVERTFTVSKPVDVVVDYLKDFTRAQDWDPGTVRCTRSDSGPVTVGSRWHNVSEFRGKQTELDYTLERLEPGRVTFVGTNETATSTDDITVSPAGGGSTVTYNAHIEFHGLAKLADPFMKRVFDSLGDKTQEQMATVINAL